MVQSEQSGTPVSKWSAALPSRLCARRRRVAAAVVAAALWGLVVDANVIPALAPTGNSTLVQATTAALCALVGIAFGPAAGALVGLLRDGSGYVVRAVVEPGAILHSGVLVWAGRAVMDILEDVVLGLVPGLVARRTRRVGTLAAVAAITAWLSLPVFLVAGDVLLDGRPDLLWRALTTRAGDWNEPADPGLAIYALATGALVALALALRQTQRRRAAGTALALGIPALALIALGAHP